MHNYQPNFQSDVDAVSSIAAVSSILEVICRTTGMGFAAVARVTETRWVACAVRDEIQFGLVPGGELKVETTICDEIRQSHEAVIIDHVAEDEAYCGHPTPAMYGFQSYISVPVFLKNGSFFGTLCAIDPKPAHLNTPETKQMFKLFAELIAFHLAATDQLAVTETKLLEERKTAELRDQFIAILGHDLRSPVGAVSNSAQILNRMPLPDSAGRFISIIQDCCYRMSGLIENVLDFARGRLGGGIILNRTNNEPLKNILNEVITEMRSVSPDREIDVQFNLTRPVNCDVGRIAQLFSNVLGNAIKYGTKDAPVKVQAQSGAGEFMLSVSNAGNEIPFAVKHHLFQPFFRGDVLPQQQGLGLGLYIASEIARAHGGVLTVSSTQEETCFTFRLPQ